VLIHHERPHKWLLRRLVAHAPLRCTLAAVPRPHSAGRGLQQFRGDRHGYRDRQRYPSSFDCRLTFAGSSQLRAGWASESSPRLAIENLVARYKERKAPKTYCLVGNDVLADQGARAAAKSPFEGPVISNWDLMVCLLYLWAYLVGNSIRLHLRQAWSSRRLYSKSNYYDGANL
jgi:hypothetical protein